MQVWNMTFSNQQSPFLNWSHSYSRHLASSPATNGVATEPWSQHHGVRRLHEETETLGQPEATEDTSSRKWYSFGHYWLVAATVISINTQPPYVLHTVSESAFDAKCLLSQAEKITVPHTAHSSRPPSPISRSSLASRVRRLFFHNHSLFLWPHCRRPAHTISRDAPAGARGDRIWRETGFGPEPG